MTYYPLINRTHYSIQQAFSKPPELVARAKELGYTALGICDYDTLAGCVEFWEECKNAEIKPILGVHLTRPNTFLFAKNKKGWHDLMKVVSLYNFDKPYDLTQDIVQVSPESIAKEDTHYVNKEDKDLWEILVCAKKNVQIEKFRYTDTLPDCYLRPFDEFKDFWSEEKINKTAEIAGLCEEYDITSNPQLPNFPCPDGKSVDDYLKEICRIGWRERIQGKVSKEKEGVYGDRVKSELEILLKYGLSVYFLIIHDIVKFIRGKGWTCSARGSAAGCLISYLLTITTADPIKYGLSFSRFFNHGRIKPGQISLPDIDLDVPPEHRDEIISYIKGKYGAERVAQMVTFGRYQGRSSMREVARLSGISNTEINDLTKPIPDEAKISDQLEIMDEDEKSIIMWTLINKPNELSKWCEYRDGQLIGEYANLFDKAIRLEGTFKNKGKHAAGVIVSLNPLEDVCLMIPDKDGNPICGFEMNHLEKLGLTKLDVLGLQFLSKIMAISKDLESKL